MATENEENVLDCSVKIRRNKCFKEEFAGFDCIKPINVVIGRNNSGKSILLDMIEFLVMDEDRKRFQTNSIIDPESEFLFTNTLSEDVLKQIFKPNTREGGITSSGEIYGDHWQDCGRYLIECPIEFCADWALQCQSARFIKSSFPVNYRHNADAARQYIVRHIKREFIPDTIASSAENKAYRRLTAERDIVPEDQDNNLALSVNGVGATNIIRAFLHNSKLDRNVIRKDLLDGLNSIFQPDNTFTEITSRQIEGNKWEVFLYEDAKATLIPLSKSGSGLKTILLVLLNLLVVPKIGNEQSALSDYIFAFEELENNLHPALLRRLYRYIEDFADQNKSTFFITTHSNVMIDFFSRLAIAQIVHVTHDGTEAKTETISNFIGQNAVLDDLGVRASDLLQANGIVWLEGPSDRIYFNKWVEIYSGGKLREHRDYECAFYGGAILAHHQAAAPNDAGDFVNIFRINRNAILLADSDKKNDSDDLKARVARMEEQIDKTRGLPWVFKAREIENYIPPECIRAAFADLPRDLPSLGKFQDFSSYRKKLGFPAALAKSHSHNELSHLSPKNIWQNGLTCQRKWRRYARESRLGKKRCRAITRTL